MFDATLTFTIKVKVFKKKFNSGTRQSLGKLIN